MSQCEVAEILGISQAQYSRIEGGQRDVDLAVAFQICDVIGVDIRDFANKYL
jgi:transcriptional regulator with XRE-family HTH domain